MGINGLLPLLKSIHKPCNLKKFEGKTLGVDAYGWLHRGTVACAMDLAMGRPTRKFVDFAMHRVRMLQHFGVTPFLIFDGDYLPSKAATEADRSKRREDSRKAGIELQNAGKTSQAYLEFQKAVDVTPEMARQLIDELKKTGVQYIVAPYEADAQMVYLERKGIIHGILSEDSDLLVFGAKCLLTKLDQYGNCIEINKADFCAVKEISLTGWSDTEFRYMAILSGCDYLASISNMGLKTAYRMVRKHKTIEKVIRMLQFDGKFFVPKTYLGDFNRAELTFLHQRVFCPNAQRLVLHTEPEQPIDEDNMPYIGAHVDPKIAQGVARGDLNPITKLPMVSARRSNMVTAMSPWSTPRTQSRSMSIGESMKGKPIETFFNAKRTPLAELDVNCFTPSPSQQDVLQRNSGSFQSSPILLPRPYISQPNTLPDHQPRPTTQTTEGRTTRSVRAPTLSEPRPSKRARLCEEFESIMSTTQKTEPVRSHFFGAADPSPSVGRASKGRRSKKQDITIFSDDSIEDAMLSIPDMGVKIEVVREGKEEDSRNDVSSPQSSQHLTSAPIHQSSVSQHSPPALSMNTSAPSSAEQSSTPIEQSSAPLAPRQLGDLYSYSAVGNSTPRAALGVNGMNTPMSTTAKPSRIPLAVKSTTLSSKASVSTRKGTLTPLQRLGFKAANRTNLPMTPADTPILPVTHKSLRRSLLGKDSLPFPEVACVPMKKAAVDPASISLPEPDNNEALALEAVGKGSEDLIVHDSEEECLSPTGEHTSTSRLVATLGQFVYTG